MAKTNTNSAKAETPVKITVNFKEFNLYKDISQTETVMVDARLQLADLMYKNLNGIVAHDLALRIYRSTGPIELTEQEMQMLLEFAKNTTPIFFDSLQNNFIKN